MKRRQKEDENVMKKIQILPDNEMEHVTAGDVGDSSAEPNYAGKPRNLFLIQCQYPGCNLIFDADIQQPYAECPAGHKNRLDW